MLLFISLYLFTREAYWESWDFSATGQIGDTIGGITAPIINIIGAFLVWISFREQVLANRLQTEALNEERQRNELNRSFEHFQTLYDKLIDSFKGLEFMVIKNENTTSNPPTYQSVQVRYHGFTAISEYIFRLEDQARGSNRIYYNELSDSGFGLFLEFRFLLANMLDFMARVDSASNVALDRVYFQKNVKSFYEISIKEFLERMLAVLPSEDEKVKVVIALKVQIEMRLISYY